MKIDNSNMALIKSLAWNCYKRLPNNCCESFEDLVQEGMIRYHRVAVKTRYRPSRGASFRTLLYRSLVNRYANILRDAYKLKRSSMCYMSNLDMDEMPNNSKSPLDLFIEKEEEALLIDRLEKIDKDIADLVRCGPSIEFLRYVKSKERITGKKFKSIFSKRIIEKFYGVDLNRISFALQKCSSGV